MMFCCVIEICNFISKPWKYISEMHKNYKKICHIFQGNILDALQILLISLSWFSFVFHTLFIMAWLIWPSLVGFYLKAVQTFININFSSVIFYFVSQVQQKAALYTIQINLWFFRLQNISGYFAFRGLSIAFPESWCI